MAGLLSQVPVVNRLLGLVSSRQSIDVPPVEVHSIETDPDRRARCLKHLLKANHANYSIVYHNLEFDNHNPHVLSSAYLLGASVSQLNDIYDKQIVELEPWVPSPAEVGDDDWEELRGDRRYQRAFVDYFEDKLVMRFNYDWRQELVHYLFTASATACIMSDPKACWECHKRRLICDFGSPACQKCEARGVACPGYGEKKPLKWLQPGQTRSKGKRARKEVNVIRLTLKDPSEATSVFEAIEYFNTHICPDLVANGAGGGSNCPFILHPSEAPYIPTAIRHTMVSIALAHRVLQSEQGFETDRALFSTRLQKHRGAAIRHLASDLVPGSQPDTITLVSILTFLLAEVQQSFSSSWRQHCDAANTVVELLGGMSTILLCYPFIRPVVRYYILIEIVSTTTAPVVEEARARRQMEILGFLPMAFNMGLFTTVPCAPELLVDIVFVNHLQSQAQAYEGAVFDTNLQKASLDLLQRIQSFSVESWVTGIDLNEKLNEDPNKPSKQRQAISWDWQSVAYIYHSAVALYCISSLLYPQYTQDMPQTLDEDVDIAAIRSAYLATLLSNIKDIASGSNLQLRKMLIWPLVIAGIEVDVNDEASKKLICGELAWISKVVGTASPLVAHDFLSKLWKSDWIPTGYGRRSWNSIFDRPYVFVM